MLLPGVGAQGGSPADVARAFTSGPASALVNASRSVMYAYRATGAADWRSAAGAEAARLRARSGPSRAGEPVDQRVRRNLAALRRAGGVPRRDHDPRRPRPLRAVLRRRRDHDRDAAATTTHRTTTHATTTRRSRRRRRARPRPRRRRPARSTTRSSRGDTFGSIAAAEGTTIGALEQLNPDVNPNALSVGQQIRIK